MLEDAFLDLLNEFSSRLTNYIEVISDDLYMTIEQRPKYCDRGRYFVKVSNRSFDQEKQIVDHQDGFPRYYYFYSCLISEMSNFFRKKKQNILSVELKFGLKDET